MTLITCLFGSFKKVSRWASLSKYFNKPLREKCGYRKLLKKHFCWILSSTFSVFDFSESGSLPLSINALRHVCRRWPISTRSRESAKLKYSGARVPKLCKNSYERSNFSIWSANIVKKYLGAVQFLNFYIKGRFYLVLALQSKGLFCNFGHIFFQTTVSSLPLGALKYHHRVAATHKYILVRVSCLKRNFPFFQSD